MQEPSLNRTQRIIVVVGLGIAFFVSGQWLTTLGSNLPNGWVAYAPLSKEFAPDGLQTWVRYLIWLALFSIWTLISAALLRSNPSRQSDQE
jgi:hypothetical protein